MTYSNIRIRQDGSCQTQTQTQTPSHANNCVTYSRNLYVSIYCKWFEMFDIWPSMTFMYQPFV